LGANPQEEEKVEKRPGGRVQTVASMVWGASRVGDRGRVRAGIQSWMKARKNEKGRKGQWPAVKKKSNVE